jgi:hypothetical protein
MESAPTVDSPHVAFASPATSYSRVDTNQPEIQPTTSPLPTPATILSNHHPMLTREKNGIQKPRVLCASNYPLPQRFVVLPPTSVPCEPLTFDLHNCQPRFSLGFYNKRLISCTS